MNMEVSCLIDDEIDGRARDTVLDRLRHDSDLRDKWLDYHLIGDALRRAPALSPDFNRKLARRLADEPTVIAPGAAPRRTTARPLVALSAAASLAAVGMAGWAMAQISQEQQQVRVVDRLQLPQSRVNPYLFAHQEFSPSVAIQGSVSYVRSVAATTDGQRK